VTRPPAAR